MLMILIFLPAGTLSYWNGWLFMGVLFVPIFFMGVILFIKNPGLLHKRLDSKEKESEQKNVQAWGGVMFICGFIIAGFDYRFQWLPLPKWVTIGGAAVIFLLAYPMIIAKRIRNEEQVLEVGLEGYIEYKNKVKYRIIPFLW